MDLLIPAAVENVLTEETAGQVRARAVLEAANGPTTPAGEAVLRARGIPVIPDILANSGGVIASYVEWRQAKSGSMTRAEETYETIGEQMDEAFAKVLEMARGREVSYRVAAQAVAVRELIATMQDRGWIPG